ncbi:MAG: hypothetical protein QXZ43_02715 [Candidatus Aenigmatarchaeota archaeon]
MNRKGISISIGISEFISLLVLLGVAILIIRFFFSGVIKLKIEKEEYSQAGKVINLANVIIMSPEVSSLDENNQPKKGIIDKEKLKSLSEKNKPLDCCDYIDYDYSLVVKIIDQNYNIGYSMNYLNELFNKGKKCKAHFDDEILKSYKFPLIIQDNEKKYNASFYLTLSKTPISFIATELNVACVKKNYENIINLYGFNKNSIKINKIDSDYYEICLTTYKKVDMCKKIKCENDISIKYISEKCNDNIKGKCENDCSYFFDQDCKENMCISALITSDEKGVKICFVEEEKDFLRC